MQPITMEIEPNSRRHVVLYAMLAWFVKHNDEEYLPLDPDVVPSAGVLREHSGPLRSYDRQYVASTMNQLKEDGLVQKLVYYEKTLGWALTGDGADTLEALGTPKQYDH